MDGESEDVVTTNRDIASRLDEVAQILEEQGASAFRVRAYRQGASTLRGLERSVAGIFEEGGMDALEALPHVGPSLARAIRELLRSGRLPMLERMRGESDPVALFLTVPGIGTKTARRLHDDLGLESLEALEAAAHDGRLARLVGLGPKRLAGIRESLAQRLARVRGREPPRADPPPVAEVLDVDAEYRGKAQAGSLRTIAPRRFNPKGRAWLPILHTQRGDRHYTALFSNTPRAHRFGATRDWVVVYLDGPGEGQWTVVTARHGPLAGRRVVRGREAESRQDRRPREERGSATEEPPPADENPDSPGEPSARTRWRPGDV
jgi:DNA polymerase (family 10)